MAIKYRATKNANNIKGDKATTYYARAISDGEVAPDELLTILSKKTKLNKVDCLRFIMYLEETMVEQLRDGKIVRLGGIGSFQVGITSKGVDTAAKVTASTITTAKVNFRVGNNLKEMFKELVYKKIKG